ncbi:MAG: hypothetical protein AAFX52_04680 [Pseudomonadota bacterium]
MDFIDQYLSIIDLPLGLSLAGVFVTLVTTLLRIDGNGSAPRTLALLGVALASFVVASLYLFITKIEAQTRSDMLAAIKTTVDSTEDTVVRNEQILQVLVRRFSDRTVEQVARGVEAIAQFGTEVALVDDQDMDQPDEVREFSKGGAPSWRRYADALSRADPSIPTSLSLLTGREGSRAAFDARLLFAWLVTPRRENMVGYDTVRDAIETGSWMGTQGFPTEVDVREIRRIDSELDWVFFYDELPGGQRELVAFAPADHFTLELFAHIQSGTELRVEEVFNADELPLAALKKLFPSIDDTVFRTDSAADAVTKMVAQGDDLAMIDQGPKSVYELSLAKAVRVVQDD